MPSGSLKQRVEALHVSVFVERRLAERRADAPRGSAHRRETDTTDRTMEKREGGGGTEHDGQALVEGDLGNVCQRSEVSGGDAFRSGVPRVLSSEAEKARETVAMGILDTDHVSALEWAESSEAQRLAARLEHLTSDARATTIISVEEQTRLKVEDWTS